MSYINITLEKNKNCQVALLLYQYCIRLILGRRTNQDGTGERRRRKVEELLGEKGKEPPAHSYTASGRKNREAVIWASRVLIGGFDVLEPIESPCL